MTRRPPVHAAPPRRAFTLFEVLIALTVFALAALGIAQAISGGIDAAMAARNRSLIRTMLESRLAFCQALPPPVGAARPVEEIPPGFRVREILESFAATNAEGKAVENLFRLTVTAARIGPPEEVETASILLFQPQPPGGAPP